MRLTNDERNEYKRKLKRLKKGQLVGILDNILDLDEWSVTGNTKVVLSKDVVRAVTQQQ